MLRESVQVRATGESLAVLPCIDGALAHTCNGGERTHSPDEGYGLGDELLELVAVGDGGFVLVHVRKVPHFV